ncbi:MAG TPA: Ig-like domain-containing protein [Solirubrobacteraceae bacterium]|nr:Ig-like domain-containing protein [Solirubrobacteraceae bacterium]
MPKKIARSPRATLLTIAALSALAGFGATPLVASAHPRHLARAVSASAADREARLQEREARLQEREARARERAQMRAARREERAAARAERLAERSQRQAARAQERAARHAGTTDTGEASAPATPPAPAASTRGCRMSIQTSASLITAGEAVTVSGKVTCPATGESAAAAAAAGRQVSIERAQQGGGGGGRAFAALATVSTEADGSYQLSPVTLSANTRFRVRLGRHGAHTAVRVAPVVTLNAPVAPAASAAGTQGGHVRQARRATFTGTVAPAAPGARVALQVSYPADGEQWRTIAYGDVVDGSFSISRAFKIPGEAKVRVLAHPKGANAPGISEAVTYMVPQPQNPRLTIETSADPIPFGQTVTISGVAADAPGQTVTLLARTRNGSFAPVATSTADDSGNYQFLQTPEQSTYYEVSDSATRSIPLFEGVKYVLTLSGPPTSIAAGEQLTLSGTVSPARAGTTVVLDRRGAFGVGFHAIASATVAADGTFTLSRTFATAGSATLRVRVPSDGFNAGSASAPFTLTVTGAPASALAPEPVAPAS